jgi:steroid 5-alpha reductase family enzyme
VTELGPFLAATAAWALGAMVALWAVSLRLRDASIVDVWWGPGFAAIAALGFALTGGGHPRRALLLALACVWGLRLGGYLLWRNAGKGEDRRYRAMRRHWGARFPWVSLGTVFLLQGALMWVVSLPLQLGMARPGPPGLGLLDALGVTLFAVGLAFETVGDLQLARFKADPANAGRVMDRGLWRTTRHPNYFGDFLVWWGLFAVALATPLGALSVVGPAVMTFLLLRVSGVALLERSIGERRPGYAEYRRRTSAFFPRPPRAG